MACTRGPRHRGTLTHNKAIEWRCNERSEASVDRRRRHHLRHSFASLLLHEGRSVVYVARQLGHGAQMTLVACGPI
jgi:integrase